MAKTNDPLKALDDPDAARLQAITAERDKLQATVTTLGNELEAMRKVAENVDKGFVANHYAPTVEELQGVWGMAYNEAVKSIFQKGLSFWNGKTKALKGEFELAVIRADEAVEGYIRVRKTFMDPATKEAKSQQLAKNTNPLAAK